MQIKNSLNFVALLLALLFIIPFQGYSTHIVGGEFELTELNNGFYDITLNLYFDHVNGNAGAIDQQIDVAIFDKKTNTRQQYITIPFREDNIVPYENPACATPDLAIRLIKYEINNFRFSTIYTDPQGYYIVYERCCRNNAIDNIINPGDVGMVFYSEFPPIYNPDMTMTGYSSPKFNPLYTRYACHNEYFYMDFGATDADGDSLVYSMSKPMIGSSSFTMPVVTGPSYQPAPYAEVTWVAGYNKDDAIHGSPSLKIDSETGKLELNANALGLYVYGVTCEEYRDGVKIGEARRDFQILVGACAVNDPPAVLMDNENQTGFYVEGDTIHIEDKDDKCFEFYITDDQDPRHNEKISVKIEPLNFIPSSPLNTNQATGFVGGPGDTLTGIEMCWPTCQFDADEVYKLNVIVSDDGCILPKTDTVEIVVFVEASENDPPDVTANTGGVIEDTHLTVNGVPDSLLSILITGIDVDSSDILFLEGVSHGFTFDDVDIQFSNVSGSNGNISSVFNWVPTCEMLDEFGYNYQFHFLVKDNSCNQELHGDTMAMEIIFPEWTFEENFLPPNVFTPNGDGFNDLFRLPAIPKDICGTELLMFTVYNRWGRTVYENDNESFVWDGGSVPDGVYHYVAEYESQTLKGYISVLR